MIKETTSDTELASEEPLLSPTPISEDKGLVRAAGILAVGNVVSRLLGLVREMVKAFLFGTNILSAYETAVLIPNSLNELIIGGMVNSALVPVFSDYASKEKRAELWGLVSTFISIATIILLLAVILVELFTPQAAALVGAINFTDVTLTATSIRLMQLVTPAVFFMSISSILTGLLFALKRFTLPAFVGAVFNGSIVLVALLRPDNISSLVWGMLLGTVLQVGLQLPALRDAQIQWQINWKHPALRRIFWLYLPILTSIAVNQAAVAFAYNLATRTGDSSLTYMRFATTLYQFPIGLVVTAISIAILPTLSKQANENLATFKQTLAEGIKLAITLIVPAAIGLFALATPLVMLVFERGEFTPADSVQTARVLQLFTLGLPFIAVDQMLIFASYARKDTWRPALVGVISIIVYSIVGWLLLESLGLLSLMVADGVKHSLHTIIMLLILKRRLGGLAGHGILKVLLKALIAGIFTGIAAYGVAEFIQSWLLPGILITRLLVVGVAGISGLLVYAGIARLLKLTELQAIVKLLPGRR